MDGGRRIFSVEGEEAQHKNPFPLLLLYGRLQWYEEELEQ